MHCREEKTHCVESSYLSPVCVCIYVVVVVGVMFHCGLCLFNINHSEKFYFFTFNIDIETMALRHLISIKVWGQIYFIY